MTGNNGRKEIAGELTTPDAVLAYCRNTNDPVDVLLASMRYLDLTATRVLNCVTKNQDSAKDWSLEQKFYFVMGHTGAFDDDEHGSRTAFSIVKSMLNLWNRIADLSPAQVDKEIRRLFVSTFKEAPQPETTVEMARMLFVNVLYYVDGYLTSFIAGSLSEHA